MPLSEEKKYPIIQAMVGWHRWGKKFVFFLALGCTGVLGLSAKAQELTPSVAPEAMMGESCLSITQHRRETCKKSSETCTDVHSLDALNLIKSCAQLAQECDQLGEREDILCQPGGNGRLTGSPQGRLAKPGGVL